MLTKDLALVEYDFQRNLVVPDRLTRNRHAHYLRHAERALRVYRTGVGRTRRELHEAVRGVFAREDDCPLRRIGAFCKLLDERAEFDRDSQGAAAQLRRTVFRLAAEAHPLVRRADRLFEHEERRVKAEIAEKLGRSWSDIDAALFADVIELQRMIRFDGYVDGAALLSRYNVAQLQAALFAAESMTIRASDDFKTILRYAKLARLLHTITRQGGRYVIRLDGPATILRHTRRYGVAMARFLPALLACRGWQMHAVVRTRRGGWRLALKLSDQDGYHSHLPSPEEFDSDVEASFAQAWGDEPRDGWRLLREGEIIARGQKVFVPDFMLEHQTGKRILLEIVGFWTPEYLEAKLKTLREFADVPILLAVAENVEEEFADGRNHVVPYKSKLRPKVVLDAVESMNLSR